MGFSRADLNAYRGRGIPDLVEDGVRLLFVGINPGLQTAATQTPFAHAGNRFYPALRRAGIYDAPMDVALGMSDAERRRFMAAGLGVTNLVNRATARADELARAELRAGAAALEERVSHWQPRAVAIVGLTAYRAGFSRPRAEAGQQREQLGGVALWVLPNPSGLNAHETVDSLARAYMEPARAAGLLLPSH